MRTGPLSLKCTYPAVADESVALTSWARPAVSTQVPASMQRGCCCEAAINRVGDEYASWNPLFGVDGGVISVGVESNTCTMMPASHAQSLIRGQHRRERT